YFALRNLSGGKVSLTENATCIVDIVQIIVPIRLGSKNGNFNNIASNRPKSTLGNCVTGSERRPPIAGANNIPTPTMLMTNPIPLASNSWFPLANSDWGRTSNEKKKMDVDVSK
ncbi:MAG: hypothetical protein ACI8RD_010747, partial [Bacillariaceae sp.]